MYLCEAAVVDGQNFGNKSVSRLVLLPDVLTNQNFIIVVVVIDISKIVTRWWPQRVGGKPSSWGRGQCGPGRSGGQRTVRLGWKSSSSLPRLQFPCFTGYLKVIHNIETEFHTRCEQRYIFKVVTYFFCFGLPLVSLPAENLKSII